MSFHLDVTITLAGGAYNWRSAATKTKSAAKMAPRELSEMALIPAIDSDATIGWRAARQELTQVFKDTFDPSARSKSSKCDLTKASIGYQLTTVGPFAKPNVLRTPREVYNEEGVLTASLSSAASTPHSRNVEEACTKANDFRTILEDLSAKDLANTDTSPALRRGHTLVSVARRHEEDQVMFHVSPITKQKIIDHLTSELGPGANVCLDLGQAGTDPSTLPSRSRSSLTMTSNANPISGRFTLLFASKNEILSDVARTPPSIR
ncbi:hypothetical protein BV22DRAFT_1131726 [Leucogyrophana mollusca]|uniref:Uncharacterized protein n=1 Tax=Leucogyrophana mollusca TaxID=85980 RepID=A0ACB8B9J0_9AGAM|nr:hypothetical protein BV22DRAFT_1131726 [Leucogyrophana mollusca]